MYPWSKREERVAINGLTSGSSLSTSSLSLLDAFPSPAPVISGLPLEL